jgi:2-polyprenyl-3-methyl-5-hydroxy-6-metoxy-1,4-benzoquinol methylase
MCEGHSSQGAVPDPLVYPLTDNGRLVEIVSKVLNRPEDWVREVLYHEEICLGTHHREEFRRAGLTPHVPSASLDAFYRETLAGPTGHAAWNRRPEKLAIRKWIAGLLHRSRTSPLDVLTIGDGAGFDSLYLSQCGHRVAYSEECRYCVELARKIFEDNHASIRIIENRRDIPEAAYDMVVCLDVLQHVASPPELVADFGRYLRQDGYLIVHAPFFFVSELNPTHLESNVKYSGDLRRLYGKHGFRLLDGRLFWDPLVLVRGAPEANLPAASVVWRCVLRATGVLLAFARVWRGPHNWIAARAMQKGNSQWLDGLRPQGQVR